MFPHAYFTEAYFPPEFWPPVLGAVGDNVWIIWMQGE